MALAVPIGLILAYGAARLFTQAFGELRDGLFIVPTQHAIRTLALQTFRHLHGLSIRFHLNRQTGGLTTAINRGAKGIEFLLRFMLLNFVPTFIEILLVCAFFLGLWAVLCHRDVCDAGRLYLVHHRGDRMAAKVPQSHERIG